MLFSITNVRILFVPVYCSSFLLIHNIINLHTITSVCPTEQNTSTYSPSYNNNNRKPKSASVLHEGNIT